MTGDDDVELTYVGPFARIPRPMTANTIRSLMRAGAFLFAFGGITFIPVLVGWTKLADDNEAGLAVLSASAFLSAIPLALVSNAQAATLARFFPPIAAIGFMAAIANVSLSVLFAGPRFPGASVFYVQAYLLAFIALRRPWAIAATVLATAGFALVLLALVDPVAPAQHFLNVVAAAVSTAVLIGGLTGRLDRTQTRLNDINRRLRRFLDPQVADAVSSREELLAPHRRSIAALFVDLRGFTRFTNSVEPTRVVEVLADYYAAVGTLVDEYGGTLGGFDGDGVFAFFGDPVPSDTAAADALALAKATATQLDELTLRWADADAPLGYGIGLAYGEATIGLIGSEGRLDYTPVGACVNLAARLCADAHDGEIVIDDALRKEAGVKRPKRRAWVDLKGFGEMATFGVSH